MEGEATYTVGEAARILKLGQHRVRQLLREGTLEGFRDETTDRWFAYQRAVHALKEERHKSPSTPYRRSSEARESPESAFVPLEVVRDLERELGRVQGEFQARQELSEVAESTLREQLQREQERADRLEEELREERQRGFWARLFGR
jgi:hypothetical protein